MRRRNLVILAVLVAAGDHGGSRCSASTSIKPYVVAGRATNTRSRRCFSVDDTVPCSEDPKQYRMVGIPDGLGRPPEWGRHVDLT